MTRPLPMTRDERIAIAGATILACLGPADQLDAEHQSSLEDPAVVQFAVLVPNWSRSADLADAVDLALTAKSLTSWIHRRMERRGDGTRVTINVQVGAR